MDFLIGSVYSWCHQTSSTTVTHWWSRQGDGTIYEEQMFLFKDKSRSSHKKKEEKKNLLYHKSKLLYSDIFVEWWFIFFHPTTLNFTCDFLMCTFVIFVCLFLNLLFPLLLPLVIDVINLERVCKSIAFGTILGEFLTCHRYAHKKQVKRLNLLRKNTCFISSWNWEGKKYKMLLSVFNYCGVSLLTIITYFWAIQRGLQYFYGPFL